MLTPDRTRTVVWILLLLLQTGYNAFSQPSLSQYDEWIKNLSASKYDENRAYYELEGALFRKDSATVFNFLDELKSRNNRPNAYFNSRVNCIEILKKIEFSNSATRSEIVELAEQAVNTAYETDDQHLIAFTTFLCGTLMATYREMEQAAAYLLRGQDIYDKLGQTVKERYSNYVIIGEVLFHTREYEKSIYYTQKVIEIYNAPIKEADYFRARFNNTVGQNYEKLGKLDSALKYYQRSLELAQKENDPVWQGINSGFIGQVLFTQKQYAKAKPLLQYAYSVNKTNEYDHAARSLQWLARIDLLEGHKDSARIKVMEALALLKKAGNGYYLQPSTFLEMVYFTSSEVYRSLGNTDSFYYYNQLYTQLHDSLQKVVVLSSMKVAQLRIDNENNFRAIQQLEREKRTEQLERNFIIIAAALIGIIVFLYMKRVRLKQWHREQLAEQQRKVAEAELTAAKDQMQMITDNITEKSNLIEKLKEQLMHREQGTEHHQLIEDLTHQTILTEEDWENFKSLFEKIYPGFLITLKEKAPDITVAEQRMAALTRLNLTTRQIASMLGISMDSVHKTRQRLRQRLHLPADTNLEESVASF